MKFGNDANEFSIEEIAQWLDSEGADTSTAEGNNSTTPATQPSGTEDANNTEGTDANGSNKEGTNDGTNTEGTSNKTTTETQAFAHRLKDATNKARNEERESIAKELGYESYAAMQKEREKNIIENKGFDPEEVSSLVDELVKKRMSEDPELARIRETQEKEWAKREMAELKELTGGKVNTVKDIPADVLELWKTEGSLKSAYLKLHGETLIREMRAGVNGTQKASTNHLSSPNGAPSPDTGSKTRPFTEAEKKMYKFFNSDVTDEQLSKLRKEI